MLVLPELSRGESSDSLGFPPAHQPHMGGRACPLCQETEETAEHFAVVCPKLSEEREEWMTGWSFASPSFAALLEAAVVSNFKSGVPELFQHVLIANPELEAAEDEQEVKLLLDTRLSGLANMWRHRCEALEAHRNSN